MDWLFISVGALIVAAALIDIVTTVIGVSGGHGLLSDWISRTTWRLFIGVHRRFTSHAFLRVAGPAIFLAITFAWAVLLIGGWTLVFSADGSLASANATSVTLTDRIDHATALVFGGSSPLVQSASQPWSLLSRIARFTGLGLASFGLAYALPVVQSVVRFRRLARSIHGLGDSAEAIVHLSEVDGRDSLLHLFLITLTSEMTQASEEIRAYPIVPFFHSLEPSAAMPVQFAVLESYLEIRDPANSTVPDSVVLPLTSAMNAVLVVIQTHFMPRDGDIQTNLDRNDRKTLIEEWCRAEGWNATA